MFELHGLWNRALLYAIGSFRPHYGSVVAHAEGLKATPWQDLQAELRVSKVGSIPERDVGTSVLGWHAGGVGGIRQCRHVTATTSGSDRRQPVEAQS